jgi:hypothetical protein
MNRAQHERTPSMASATSKKAGYRNIYNLNPAHAKALIDSLTTRERQVAELMMPEEHLLEATDITANALYYMVDALKHKIVSGGERKQASTNDPGGSANATLALREMMSRGRLDKYVPVSDARGTWKS